MMYISYIFSRAPECISFHVARDCPKTQQISKIIIRNQAIPSRDKKIGMLNERFQELCQRIGELNSRFLTTPISVCSLATETRKSGALACELSFCYRRNAPRRVPCITSGG